MRKSGGTKGYVKCCGIPCNLWFVSGFIVLGSRASAIGFIAVPMRAIINNPCRNWNDNSMESNTSPLVLKESSAGAGRSTVIIVIGVLVSTLFGTHASPSYPASVLIGFVGEPAFIGGLFVY